MTIEQDIGDPVARRFDEFYRSHHDRLYRAISLVTGQPDVAQDAVDEAMARAAERWDSISAYDAPEGWVYRVALNWATSFFRRRNRVWTRAPSDRVWDQLPDPDVNRAVAALPATQRSVVIARYYLDWSLDQIAASLGIPSGTVKSRLNRALADLRNVLEVDA